MPRLNSLRLKSSLVSGLVVLFATASSLTAQIVSTSISASDFGYMDQYSMNSEKGYIGDEACVPTSTTNAFTLLQNLYPTVFGTALSGSTYEDWHATDRALIDAYGTKANSGTDYFRIPYGITDYLNSLPTNFTANISMSGQFSTGWDSTYTKPSFISNANPTADFIYSALHNLDGVILSIDYSTRDGTYTSGGHELLASGITWDSSTSTGSISFIDPLDPSATFSSGSDNGTFYDQANAPAMITTGTITLLGGGSGSPGSLLLEYDQYDTTGITVPSTNSSQYQHIFATIDNVLALSAVPEPSNLLLLLCGLIALVVWGRFSGKFQF